MSDRSDVLLWLLSEGLKLREEVTSLRLKVDQMAVDQAQIDAKFDAINAAITGIRDDITQIKATQPPGAPMTQANFDRLSAIETALTALDAENPTTKPASPSPSA